jgi:hypothetical protein
MLDSDSSQPPSLAFPTSFGAGVRASAGSPGALPFAAASARMRTASDSINTWKVHERVDSQQIVGKNRVEPDRRAEKDGVLKLNSGLKDAHQELPERLNVSFSNLKLP